jgi:hypothetical protein
VLRQAPLAVIEALESSALVAAGAKKVPERQSHTAVLDDEVSGSLLIALVRGRFIATLHIPAVEASYVSICGPPVQMAGHSIKEAQDKSTSNADIVEKQYR